MLIAISAMSLNRVIGKDNQLPRHYPEDLQRFKTLTQGHTIIMGRKTFESIGRPLPKRKNIILTRQTDWSYEGVKVYRSIEQLLASIGDEDVYVIGGQEIYTQMLPFTDKIELTLIKKELEGDAFFPHFEGDFLEQKREKHSEFDFVSYIRKSI